MPQLDIVSFSSEIVWLIVAYFFFYYLLVLYILPRIYKILMYRLKKINSLAYYLKFTVSEKKHLFYRIPRKMKIYRSALEEKVVDVKEKLTTFRKNNLNYSLENGSVIFDKYRIKDLVNRII